MAKKTGKKPMTKTEIMRSISETTNLPKKDVVAVMEALADEINKALKSSGAGVFSIPGLVKIERKKVPARPAQKGVRNPFTGELQDRPAKPESVKVRVRALKNLKAMVKRRRPIRFFGGCGCRRAFGRLGNRLGLGASGSARKSLTVLWLGGWLSR